MIRNRSYLNMDVVLNSVACVLKDIKPITGELFSGMNLLQSSTGNTIEVGFIDDTEDKHILALSEMAEDKDGLKVELIFSDGYERISERVLELINPRITQIELKRSDPDSSMMHLAVTIAYDSVTRFKTTIHTGY